MKSEKDRRRCARKIKDAIEKHKSGKIKTEKLAKIIDDCGIDPEFWTLQELESINEFMSKSKIMVGAQYEEGDNTNRSKGFKFSPYFTTKGKYFQGPIKQMIRKALYMSEKWIKCGVIINVVMLIVVIMTLFNITITLPSFAKVEHTVYTLEEPISSEILPPLKRKSPKHPRKRILNMSGP